MVDNLVKNSHYYFRVYAENAIGISEPLETDQAIEAKSIYCNIEILIYSFNIFIYKEII
jgi:hypothetical protein